MYIKGKIRKEILEALHSMNKPSNMNCPEILFEEDVSCGCQGCSGSYDHNNVLIVDGVGPVCHNCLYNLANMIMN